MSESVRGNARDRRGEQRRGPKQDQSRGSASNGPDSSETLLLSTRFGPTFADYRTELDTLNFTRESIYKIARDITLHSKRVIGHLQRIKPGETYLAHLEVARNDIFTINKTLMYDLYLALSPELVQYQATLIAEALQQLVTLTPTPEPPTLSLYWVCLQKFAFSLEEYVEALSFYYYLLHGGLMPRAWLQELVAHDLLLAQHHRVAADLAHAPLPQSVSPRDERRVADSRAQQLRQPPACRRDEIEAPACNDDGSNAADAPADGIAVQAFPVDCLASCSCTLYHRVSALLPHPSVPVGVREVLLGYFDLTGEVMRFVVSNASARSHVDPSEDVARAGARFISTVACQLQLLCQQHARTMGLREKDIEMKLRALSGSLEKVERICYQWKTRRAEYGEEELQRIMAMMAREREEDGAKEE